MTGKLNDKFNYSAGFGRLKKQVKNIPADTL
jgi:hypothetical protein